MRAPKRKPSMGPSGLTGSREAKRQAAVLLEVLAGLRGPRDGSRVLGVSVNRYYQLETRALQGFITALEARPRGRQRRPEDELARLRHDKQRLERELGRSQALLRAAQRSLGLPRARAESDGSRLGPTGKGTKQAKRRRARTTLRASKAIAALRLAEGGGDGETSRRGQARGPAGGAGGVEASAAGHSANTERRVQRGPGV